MPRKAYTIDSEGNRRCGSCGSVMKARQSKSGVRWTCLHCHAVRSRRWYHAGGYIVHVRWVRNNPERRAEQQRRARENGAARTAAKLAGLTESIARHFEMEKQAGSPHAERFGVKWEEYGDSKGWVKRCTHETAHGGCRNCRAEAKRFSKVSGLSCYVVKVRPPNPEHERMKREYEAGSPYAKHTG